MRATSDAEAALLRERARRSAHFFLFESGLVTKDEHDISEMMKPFPDEPYLRSLLDCLLVGGRFLAPEQASYALAAGHSLDWLRHLGLTCVLMLEKSRQIMATWMVCGFCLWRAKYHPNQLILVQSKKEEDAANLVYVKEPYFARISFLEYHLPKALKTLTFPKHGAYSQLFFPNGSRIWGIPEGGAIIRSNTPSLLVSDEAAFQAEFSQAYTAALPAVKGGGQMVCISSAEPGAFAELVEAVY